MNDTIIRLPEETVYYLQRLDYEIAGLQVLHTHALKAGTPLEKRLEIRREFQETFAEYQMAKDEMWAEYAPRFPNTAKWWVDFQTGELHVETGNPQSRLTPCHVSPVGSVGAERSPQATSAPLFKGAKGQRNAKPPLKRGDACRRHAPIARPSRQARSVAAGDGGFQGPGSEVVHHA